MNARTLSPALLFASALLVPGLVHAQDPDAHQVLEAVVGVPDTHIGGHGRIATDSIQSVFGAVDRDIRACAPRNTFVLVLNVGQTGSVDEVTLIRHSLSSEQEACIRGITSSLVFAAPTPEQTTAVISRVYHIQPM
jgi:hypothetical protein